MHKGLLSVLWVIFFSMVTGCKPVPTVPPVPPVPPVSEAKVTGKIMLGPVVRGHSLKLVIYDADMKELDRPLVGIDGSYGFKLKDYTGVVIAQVTSANPDQCPDDYIDEATAKPKCLGKNTILSSRFVESGTTDNQTKLHTTPVTTVAVIHAGVNLNDDGSITLPKDLTREDIAQSNTAIAKVFGLGDKSIAEYTPKSIITTDQKFQAGDAYSQALAEISGIEAQGKSLNSIVKLISTGLEKNGKLSPAVQDIMVKGSQQVFTTAKEQGADTSILNQINKRQDTYPDSIAKVDMVNAPEPPDFTNKTKTFNQKPTWQWVTGGTGNNLYQYRFGTEDDIQNIRGWTETSSSSFTSKDNLKPGKYILEIQEGHTSDQKVWSQASKSIIEIVENQKGSVAIQGKAIQGKRLLAVPTDKDGIHRTVKYQWYRENQHIMNATDSEYVLTEDDVNTAIMVKVSYIDNIDYAESDIQSAPVKVVNIDDKPVLTKLNDVMLNEDDATKVIALEASDIDNDDKAITYAVVSNNSEIAKVVISANKQLQITPKQNQYGEAKVTVTAISNGLNDEKKFNIIINNTNDAPVANNLVIQALEQVSKSFKLEGSDVDHAVESLTYKIMEQPKFGGFIENPSDANAMVAYKSNSDTETQDSFSYKVCDPANFCSQLAKVTINITDPPRITQTNDQTEEVDINSKSLAEFKFQVTHDRAFKFSYLHRNLHLATHTDRLNLTWIEASRHKHPEKSDDGLYWTWDFQYNIDYIIRDNTMKDSLRAVVRAEETRGDKLNTYYAFVIKPTKIIDEKNNFKLQHNLTWVDVCWKISKNIFVSESADTNIKETKRTIIKTITNSWQKHSALQFDWREDDWSRVELTDGKPSNCSDNYTSTYPQIQVHLNAENDSSDSDASSDKNIVAININEDGRMKETDEDIQTYKIIHAFGHALGFPDENKRFDTYLYATNESFCDEEISFNLVNPKSSTKSDVIKTNAVKIISYKDWQQQPYDPLSIMNECRFASSTSELSVNDIKRVQQYYGIRIVDNPHLIKEDEFFTGLYLEGYHYFYYYNGVKSKDFASLNKMELVVALLASVKKSEIEKLDSDIHFELASTDKKKSILFRYEKGDDIIKYIEPENSPLTFCKKTITDSQNQNTNDNLKLGLDCENVNTYKERFGQGDGSIYYRVNNVDEIYVVYCEGPKPQNKDCISMQDFLSGNSTLYVKGISYNNDNNYLR